MFNQSIKFRWALLCFAGISISCTGSARRDGAEELWLAKKPCASDDEFVKDGLNQAQRHYADGVRAHLSGDDKRAQEQFELAIAVLSDLDLDESTDVALVDRFDMLLTHIANDYRKTLSTMESLPEGSSVMAMIERVQAMKVVERQVETLRPRPEVNLSQFDVPIVINDEVRRCLDFYQTTGREPFLLWLERSGKYCSMMKKIFKDKGMPQDLVYLVLIESGFNPRAYSWAHAVGPWQFVYQTGRRYSLERTWWYDERRDPLKSTFAAAEHLKDLYEQFNSWPLALAAYNCGEGKVLRAIKTNGHRDYWKLDLPRQTRNYVPLYMAATIIAKEPKRYGFNPDYQSPEEYDIVTIDECIDLQVASNCAQTDYEVIKDLNPEIRRWCTPPNVSSYKLKIPAGTSEVFWSNYAKVPDEKKVSWVRHRVKAGETVSQLAHRYHTSPWAIVEANSLENRHRIVAGQYLLIPSPPSRTTDTPPISEAPSQEEVEVPGRRKLIYIVKKGDTVGQIAEDFGVWAKEIRHWNGLKSRQYIYPGDELVIWARPGFQHLEGSDDDGGKRLVYIVRSGDTLSNIAGSFGVKVEDLCRWNQLKLTDIIFPGKELEVFINMKTAGGE